MKDIYQDLLDKYRKQVDQTTSEVFEHILEKEQLINWERELEKVIKTLEKVLVN